MNCWEVGNVVDWGISSFRTLARSDPDRMASEALRTSLYNSFGKFKFAANPLRTLARSDSD